LATETQTQLSERTLCLDRNRKQLVDLATAMGVDLARIPEGCGESLPFYPPNAEVSR
jgi:hypothetical protein